MKWTTKKTGTETERGAGNRQTHFGHYGNQKSLQDWLSITYAKDGFSEKRFRAIATSFLSGEPKKVLEIGAAIGDFSAHCSIQFPQHSYTVTDLAENLLKNNFPAVIEYFHSSASFELNYFAVEDMPYADDTYDVVFIKSAVHHFENPGKSFAQIRRVLKKGGKVIFLNDPICLDIPIVREIQKVSFATEDRIEGYNCKVHTFTEYMSYGNGFSKKEAVFDEIYLEEFKQQYAKWTGIKKYIAKSIYASPFLFRNFMIYTFAIPYLFVFTK